MVLRLVLASLISLLCLPVAKAERIPTEMLPAHVLLLTELPEQKEVKILVLAEKEEIESHLLELQWAPKGFVSLQEHFYSSGMHTTSTRHGAFAIQAPTLPSNLFDLFGEGLVAFKSINMPSYYASYLK